MIETRNCVCGCGETDLLKTVEDMALQHRGQEGSLIQVLHMAQSIYGYLPIEVQRVVADALDIPAAVVSGVVSFYSLFSAQPRGKHTVRVCLGTACYVRGGKKLADAVRSELDIEVGDTTADRNFTFEVARCIGACGLAPALEVDGEVYKQVKPESVPDILARYRGEEA